MHFQDLDLHEHRVPGRQCPLSIEYSPWAHSKKKKKNETKQQHTTHNTQQHKERKRKTLPWDKQEFDLPVWSAPPVACSARPVLHNDVNQKLVKGENKKIKLEQTLICTGFYCAERKVLRWNAQRSENRKQARLSDIGKSHNSHLQMISWTTKPFFLLNFTFLFTHCETSINSATTVVKKLSDSN